MERGTTCPPERTRVDDDEDAAKRRHKEPLARIFEDSHFRLSTVLCSDLQEEIGGAFAPPSFSIQLQHSWEPQGLPYVETLKQHTRSIAIGGPASSSGGRTLGSSGGPGTEGREEQLDQKLKEKETGGAGRLLESVSSLPLLVLSSHKTGILGEDEEPSPPAKEARANPNNPCVDPDLVEFNSFLHGLAAGGVCAQTAGLTPRPRDSHWEGLQRGTASRAADLTGGTSQAAGSRSEATEEAHTPTPSLQPSREPGQCSFLSRLQQQHLSNRRPSEAQAQDVSAGNQAKRQKLTAGDSYLPSPGGGAGAGAGAGAAAAAGGVSVSVPFAASDPTSPLPRQSAQQLCSNPSQQQQEQQQQGYPAAEPPPAAAGQHAFFTLRGDAAAGPGGRLTTHGRARTCTDLRALEESAACGPLGVDLPGGAGGALESQEANAAAAASLRRYPYEVAGPEARAARRTALTSVAAASSGLFHKHNSRHAPPEEEELATLSLPQRQSKARARGRMTCQAALGGTNDAEHQAPVEPRDVAGAAAAGAGVGLEPSGQQVQVVAAAAAQGDRASSLRETGGKDSGHASPQERNALGSSELFAVPGTNTNTAGSLGLRRFEPSSGTSGMEVSGQKRESINPLARSYRKTGPYQQRGSGGGGGGGGRQSGSGVGGSSGMTDLESAGMGLTGGSLRVVPGVGPSLRLQSSIGWGAQPASQGWSVGLGSGSGVASGSTSLGNREALWSGGGAAAGAAGVHLQPVSSSSPAVGRFQSWGQKLAVQQGGRAATGVSPAPVPTGEQAPGHLQHRPNASQGGALAPARGGIATGAEAPGGSEGVTGVISSQAAGPSQAAPSGFAGGGGLRGRGRRGKGGAAGREGGRFMKFWDGSAQELDEARRAMVETAVERVGGSKDGRRSVSPILGSSLRLPVPLVESNDSMPGGKPLGLALQLQDNEGHMLLAANAGSARGDHAGVSLGRSKHELALPSPGREKWQEGQMGAKRGDGHGGRALPPGPQKEMGGSAGVVVQAVGVVYTCDAPPPPPPPPPPHQHIHHTHGTLLGKGAVRGVESASGVGQEKPSQGRSLVEGRHQGQIRPGMYQKGLEFGAMGPPKGGSGEELGTQRSSEGEAEGRGEGGNSLGLSEQPSTSSSLSGRLDGGRSRPTPSVGKGTTEEEGDEEEGEEEKEAKRRRREKRREERRRNEKRRERSDRPRPPRRKTSSEGERGGGGGVGVGVGVARGVGSDLHSVSSHSHEIRKKRLSSNGSGGGGKGGGSGGGGGGGSGSGGANKQEALLAANIRYFTDSLPDELRCMELQRQAGLAHGGAMLFPSLEGRGGEPKQGLGSFRGWLSAIGRGKPARPAGGGGGQLGMPCVQPQQQQLGGGRGGVGGGGGAVAAAAPAEGGETQHQTTGAAGGCHLDSAAPGSNVIHGSKDGNNGNGNNNSNNGSLTAASQGLMQATAAAAAQTGAAGQGGHVYHHHHLGPRGAGTGGESLAAGAGPLSAGAPQTRELASAPVASATAGRLETVAAAVDERGDAPAGGGDLSMGERSSSPGGGAALGSGARAARLGLGASRGAMSGWSGASWGTRAESMRNEAMMDVLWPGPGPEQHLQPQPLQQQQLQQRAAAQQPQQHQQQQRVVAQQQHQLQQRVVAQQQQQQQHHREEVMVPAGGGDMFGVPPGGQSCSGGTDGHPSMGSDEERALREREMQVVPSGPRHSGPTTTDSSDTQQARARQLGGGQTSEDELFGGAVRGRGTNTESSHALAGQLAPGGGSSNLAAGGQAGGHQHVDQRRLQTVFSNFQLSSPQQEGGLGGARTRAEEAAKAEGVAASGSTPAVVGTAAVGLPVLQTGSKGATSTMASGGGFGKTPPDTTPSGPATVADGSMRDRWIGRFMGSSAGQLAPRPGTREQVQGPEARQIDNALKPLQTHSSAVAPNVPAPSLRPAAGVGFMSYMPYPLVAPAGTDKEMDFGQWAEDLGLPNPNLPERHVEAGPAARHEHAAGAPLGKLPFGTSKPLGKELQGGRGPLQLPAAKEPPHETAGDDSADGAEEQGGPTLSEHAASMAALRVWRLESAKCREELLREQQQQHQPSRPPRADGVPSSGHLAFSEAGYLALGAGAPGGAGFGGPLCPFCGLKGHTLAFCSETREHEMRSLRAEAAARQAGNELLASLAGQTPQQRQAQQAREDEHPYCLRCGDVGHWGSECLLTTTQAAVHARERAADRERTMVRPRASSSVFFGGGGASSHTYRAGGAWGGGGDVLQQQHQQQPLPRGALAHQSQGGLAPEMEPPGPDLKTATAAAAALPAGGESWGGWAESSGDRDMLQAESSEAPVPAPGRKRAAAGHKGETREELVLPVQLPSAAAAAAAVAGLRGVAQAHLVGPARDGQASGTGENEGVGSGGEGMEVDHSSGREGGNGWRESPREGLRRGAAQGDNEAVGGSRLHSHPDARYLQPPQQQQRKPKQGGGGGGGGGGGAGLSFFARGSHVAKAGGLEIGVGSGAGGEGGWRKVPEHELDPEPELEPAQPPTPGLATALLPPAAALLGPRGPAGGASANVESNTISGSKLASSPAQNGGGQAAAGGVPKGVPAVVLPEDVTGGKARAELTPAQRQAEMAELGIPAGMLGALESIRLSRRDLLKWVNSEELDARVGGFFLRLRFGKKQEGLGGSGYRMAQIQGSELKKNSSSAAAVGGPSSEAQGGLVVLVVDFGDGEYRVDSQCVSNKPFMESELVEWWKAVQRKGQPIITREEAEAKCRERRCWPD